jgi:hypothetical protein
MVRHLRVGFTVGHWVTNVRTLSEKEKWHNARGVNWRWTRGELGCPCKLLMLNVLGDIPARVGSRFAQSLL